MRLRDDQRSHLIPFIDSIHFPRHQLRGGKTLSEQALGRADHHPLALDQLAHALPTNDFDLVEAKNILSQIPAGMRPAPQGDRLGFGIANTAYVIDVNTGAIHTKFDGHGKTVNGFVFAPDGERCVTGSYDGTIRLWSAKTGLQLWQRDNFHGVEGLAISPDGRLIFVASLTDDDYAWKAKPKKKVKRMLMKPPAAIPAANVHRRMPAIDAHRAGREDIGE